MDKRIDKIIAATAMFGFVLCLGFYIWNMPQTKEPINYNRIEFNSTDSTISETYLNHVLTESREFKSFVETERKQHQAFLEWTYRTGLALIGFAIALLGYIGFRVKEDAKEKLEELKKEAIEKAKLEFDKNIKVTFDNELQNTRDNLHYLNGIIKQEGHWDKAKILVISSFNDKDAFNNMKEELAFINQRKIEVDTTFFNDNLELNGYDLIIYKFLPTSSNILDENGKNKTVQNEDEELIKLVTKVKEFETLPLIVYAPNSFLAAPKTKNTVSGYKYQIFANSIFSLWNNTFDALKVKRSLENKTA